MEATLPADPGWPALAAGVEQNGTNQGAQPSLACRVGAKNVSRLLLVEDKIRKATWSKTLSLFRV